MSYHIITNDPSKEHTSLISIRKTKEEAAYMAQQACKIYPSDIILVEYTNNDSGEKGYLNPDGEITTQGFNWNEPKEKTREERLFELYAEQVSTDELAEHHFDNFLKEDPDWRDRASNSEYRKFIIANNKLLQIIREIKDLESEIEQLKESSKVAIILEEAFLSDKNIMAKVGDKFLEKWEIKTQGEYEDSLVLHHPTHGTFDITIERRK